MKKPAHIIEIFLQPGEVYFGERDTRIRTLLGSCVAITMWHPKLLIGGMCHYLLPSRSGLQIPQLDGRYGDEAILALFREAIRYDSDPGHYHIKLFGGGDMFPGRMKDGKNFIGTKNIEKARALLKQYGFSHCAEHMGGTGHRNIFFDIWSGHVWVRHQPSLPNGNIEPGGKQDFFPDSLTNNNPVQSTLSVLAGIQPASSWLGWKT